NSSASASACYGQTFSQSSSAPSSAPASQFQCSVGNINAWNTGYVATVTVTNAGSEPKSAWSVALQLPENQEFAHGWNAALTASGQLLTANNLAWNAQ